MEKIFKDLQEICIQKLCTSELILLIEDFLFLIFEANKFINGVYLKLKYWIAFFIVKCKMKIQ